jgi:hypothetical protein
VLPASKPHKTTPRTFWDSRSPACGRRDTRWSACWSCGEPCHFRGRCFYRREAANDDRRRKRDERPPRDTWEPARKSKWATKKQQRRRRGIANGWGTNKCRHTH